MQPHISVEDLERYYLGIMPKAQERATLEKHLLVCRECLQRARHVKRYINAMLPTTINRKQVGGLRPSESQSRKRLTLSAINNELARRGETARLAKASDYFYFHLGEASDWLDRVVRVPTLSRFTLNQWLAEFERLKKLNAGQLRPAKGANKRKPRAQRKKE
jgi:hypothetical protein